MQWGAEVTATDASMAGIIVQEGCVCGHRRLAFVAAHARGALARSDKSAGLRLCARECELWLRSRSVPCAGRKVGGPGWAFLALFFSLARSLASSPARSCCQARRSRCSAMTGAEGWRIRCAWLGGVAASHADVGLRFDSRPWLVKRRAWVARFPRQGGRCMQRALALRDKSRRLGLDTSGPHRCSDRQAPPSGPWARWPPSGPCSGSGASAASTATRSGCRGAPPPSPAPLARHSRGPECAPLVRYGVPLRHSNTAKGCTSRPSEGRGFEGSRLFPLGDGCGPRSVVLRALDNMHPFDPAVAAIADAPRSSA